MTLTCAYCEKEAHRLRVNVSLYGTLVGYPHIRVFAKGCVAFCVGFGAGSIYIGNFSTWIHKRSKEFVGGIQMEQVLCRCNKK